VVYANNLPPVDGIITCVVSTIKIPTQDNLRRIHRVQIVTLAWMSVEAALSLWAAWKARSPALAAFSGDSRRILLSGGSAVALPYP
jgi:hypothetical protein